MTVWLVIRRDVVVGVGARASELVAQHSRAWNEIVTPRVEGSAGH